MKFLLALLLILPIFASDFTADYRGRGFIPNGDPCMPTEFVNYACAYQGGYDGTGPGQGGAQADPQLPRVRSSEQIISRMRSAIESEQRQIGIHLNQLLTRQPEIANQIATAVGCSEGQTSAATCPLYPEAVRSIQNYLSTQVADGFPVAGVSSDSNELSLPIMAFIDIAELEPVQAIARRAVTNVDRTMVSQERRNALRDETYPRVQAAAMRVLERLPASQTRDDMIEAVRNTGMVTKYCEEEGADSLVPQAQNRRRPDGSQTIEYCMTMLMRSNSEFSAVYILGHELGHSVINTPMAALHLEPITNCLSRRQSTRTPTLSTEMMQEAFSDWLGTEVVAELSATPGSPLNGLSPSLFANGIANTFPLCEYRNGIANPNSHHLHGYDRFNLIASHPQIRRQMACRVPAPQVHCTVEGKSSTPDYESLIGQ